MDWAEYLPTIISGLLIIGGLLGITVIIKKALKQIIEFMVSIDLALEDNKISAEEMENIKKEFMDIVNEFKNKKEN